ncbi:hypothetical protein COO60DRAFT_1473635, partial [Scenedesmus sp. NREL 46B-D3]
MTVVVMTVRQVPAVMRMAVVLPILDAAACDCCAEWRSFFCMQCVQLWVLLLGPYAFAVARYRSLVSLVTCCVILWFTSVNRKKSTAAACEHLPGTLPSGAKKV